MTIEVAEKLNNLFTPGFVNQNCNLASIDALYEEVSKVDATISKIDFEEYIEVISKKMHESDEVSEEALDDVAGGLGWTTAVAIAAGIKAATDLIGFSYKAGKAFGEAIYNWRH